MVCYEENQLRGTTRSRVGMISATEISGPHNTAFDIGYEEHIQLRYQAGS